MNDDKKIEIPKDFPGEPAQVNSSVSKDPEVLAEEKKNRIWHLKLERWKEIASAMGFFLRTFRAEAISLMSGLGTLVVGWYQLRKWVLVGRKDVRHLERKVSNAETKVELTSGVPRHDIGRVGHGAGGGAGSGYGSGHGRLGSGPRSVSSSATVANRPKKTRAATPTIADDSTTLLPSSGEPIAMLPGVPTMFTDPMTYVPLLTLAVFVWSSWKAWVKKHTKKDSEGGK